MTTELDSFASDTFPATGATDGPPASDAVAHDRATTGGRVGRALASSLAGPMATAVVAAGSLAFVGLVDPNQPGHYPVCPSLTLFGVYCPLCGGLRGAHALAHGQLPAMVSSNLLLPVIVVLAVWGWLAWTTRALGRWHLPPPRLTNRAWIVFGIVALAYGVVRNLPWTPFVALAP